MNVLTEIWERVCDFASRYVAEPIMHMGVKDIVDVLLLALVLFEIYRFFRDRRAGRVMLGLWLVVLFSLIVYLFELPALTYAVRLFAASAFFCAVVIFQPEFRDALESLGNLTFFNPRSNTLPKKRMSAARHVTDETVDAVMQMAASKTGALIVFEGMTKLGDYIETGSIVDAQVSSKLLRNIFYGHSPLHDGALIIRDLRIHAASCVLPSSTRNSINFGAMGTRHRAAVGVTELSDALVIVVSEQTGIVSVAQDGRLLRELDEKTLTDILMTYIAGNAYLRQKRANMRKEYLKMLEDISHVDPPKKPVNEDIQITNLEKLLANDEADSTLDDIGVAEEERSANRKHLSTDGEAWEEENR